MKSLEGDVVSVTSACVAHGAAMTTDSNDGAKMGEAGAEVPVAAPGSAYGIDVYAFATILLLGPHGSIRLDSRRSAPLRANGLIRRLGYGTNGEPAKSGPWVLTEKGKRWRLSLAYQLRQLIDGVVEP